MTPAEDPLGTDVVESAADSASEDEPEETRSSPARFRWGRRTHGKASGLNLRLHERAETGDRVASSGGNDSESIPIQPAERRWRRRASLSTIAGAVAVLIYMIVVTPPLLSPTNGGNPFFLIIGAIVLFFLTEMLVNGLADLAVWLARWLGPSSERAGSTSPDQSQELPEGRTSPATSVAPADKRAAGDARS